MPEQWRDRRLGWCDIWYRETPDGQPLRPPGVRAQAGRRHEHDGAARDRERPRPRPARGASASTCPASGPASSAPTSSRWTSPSPRASRSPSRAPSCGGRTGRCGSASTTARARSSTRSRTTTTATTRDIAYRMSFAEMVVPYRDASFDHYRRTAFDIGEWGLGFMTTSLELGCDCLGEIRYLDAVLHDSKGEPYDDHERDLPARGGQRRPLEARRRHDRRRGPADAPAWSCPATPRSRTTSTSSTGASTRTATSSARSGRPG